MRIDLETEDRIVEHKFSVKLRTGKIVRNCESSRPIFDVRNEFCIVSIPHKDFGFVRFEFAADSVVNAMNNGTPLIV